MKKLLVGLTLLVSISSFAAETVNVGDEVMIGNLPTKFEVISLDPISQKVTVGNWHEQHSTTVQKLFITSKGAGDDIFQIDDKVMFDNDGFGGYRWKIIAYNPHTGQFRVGNWRGSPKALNSNELYMASGEINGVCVGDRVKSPLTGDRLKVYAINPVTGKIKFGNRNEMHTKLKKDIFFISNCEKK